MLQPRDSLVGRQVMGSNDPAADVSNVPRLDDAPADDDRQVRESLAAYFLILREWAMKDVPSEGAPSRKSER